MDLSYVNSRCKFTDANKEGNGVVVFPLYRLPKFTAKMTNCPDTIFC